MVAPEFSKPASTVTHALWPGLFWYSPGVVQARQLVGLDCPVSAENVPGGQSLHPDSAFTPVAEEYVPVGQSSHVAAESALKELLHFPATHNSHSVLSDLAYLPSSHSVQLPPELVLTLPGSQETQTRAPTAPADISLPASHSVQTVCPASPSV